jgi:DNA-binding GntR family transcriptional regulator
MTDGHQALRRKAGSVPVPLGQLAYHAVRNAIEAGNLTPGDRISEYKVAEWLSISRTPAREGLLRLESEGLLTSHPRRGLVVASVDNDAVRELYAAREFLEGAAAGLAAKNASRPEIDELNRLVEAEAEIADDIEALYEHNKVFHQQIHRASHNRYFVKFLLTLNDIISAERKLSTLTDKKRRQAVLREHRQIADAIGRRDDKAATAAATAHIRAALEARVKVRKESSLAKSALPPDLPRRRKRK